MTQAVAAESEARASSAVGRTLRALARSGPVTVNALVPDLGLSRPTVHVSLTELEEAGLAAHETRPASPGGRGRMFVWSVTAAGRARLAGRAPALADDCFSAIIIEDRPMTAREVTGWLQRDSKDPVPPARVRDALSWLAEDPHAVIARCPGSRDRRWCRSGLGGEITALGEWDWAGLELCLAIRRDRQSGEPGMSRAVSDGILAWAGIPVSEGGDRDEHRTSWAVSDHEGRREISWEQDSARGTWTVSFRLVHGSRPGTVREVTVPDLSALAWQIREIAGLRNPDARVTWKPGDPEEGSFWAIPGPAGACDPALASFRSEFASGSRR